MNGAQVNGFDNNEEDQFAHLDEINENGLPAVDLSKKVEYEKLPENRQERLTILLKNLPNEDLVHIDNKKFPAFLRIDKDVIAVREKVHEMHEDYMVFNISELDEAVKQSLRVKIEEVS
jgi:cold shock CspA family protein